MTEKKGRPGRQRAQRRPDMKSHPNWTINVQNFGRISRGSVTMAPLVILVGRNNTGKSYMASLIWALLNFDTYSFPRNRQSKSKLPVWFEGMIEQTATTQESLKRNFGTKEYKELGAYISNLLTEDKSKLIADLFALPEFDEPTIELKFGNEGCRDYTFATERESKGDRPVSLSYRHENDATTLITSLRKQDDILQWLPRAVYDICAADALRGPGRSAAGEVLYIPAARTGLMLAFPALVSGLLGSLRLGNSSKNKMAFSLPTIQFLQTFTDKSSEKIGENIESIISDLEKRILGGSVVASSEEIPTIMYHPARSNKVLPLHATSSMVTELAPFLLLLKSGKGLQGLVFEEPEAHLHIAAQRVMAIAISNLVNAGVPVVLTTHSDTFIQQINNLIKLYASPSQELMDEYGYKPEDLIDPTHTRAYEFKEGTGGTVIEELERTKNGFIVPTLNEPLLDLAQETMEVQSGL